MASFDENGKYIKTNWKAGDKITATKLNKIEESIEAVNDNDISRHVEADARLDALEAKDVAHDKELTNIKNTIADNKAAAELGDYDINSRMTFLENELNEGIEEVHNVASTVDGKINAAVSNVNNIASTVDGKIATAEANMTTQVNTAKDEMTAQVNQGKADMEAMVAEVEADLEGLHAKDEELSEQLAHKANEVNLSYIDVRGFGAKGDGVTDDTKAIQEAINYATLNKKTLIFDCDNFFLTTDTIMVTCDIIMNKKILYNGTRDRVAIHVTKSGKHRIMVSGYGINDPIIWDDSNFIGILLDNITFSDVTLESYYFHTGVKCLAQEGKCFAYNKIDIIGIYDCKVCLELKAKDDGSWINENIFNGGDYHTTSAVYSFCDEDNRGVLIGTTSAHRPNNNVFNKPCFQLKGTPICIEAGTDNIFNECRNESNCLEDGFVKFGSNTECNVVNVLYGNVNKCNDLGKNNYFGKTSLSKINSEMNILFNYSFAKNDTFLFKNKNNTLNGINKKLDVIPNNYGDLPVFTTNKFVELTNSNWNYGIFIEVTKGTRIKLNLNSIGNTRFYIATYNENMEFVNPTTSDFVTYPKQYYISGSGISEPNDSTNSNTIYLSITTDEIRYIRVQFSCGSGTKTIPLDFEISSNKGCRVFKKSTYAIDFENANHLWNVTNLEVGEYIPNKNLVVKSDDKGEYYVKGLIVSSVSSENSARFIEDRIYI